MKKIKQLASATVAGLSLACCPLLADDYYDDYSTEGSYVQVSIGGSQIGDIDVTGVNSDIEFDSGLGLDLGYGYDFGNIRLEATWVRGQSEKVSWVGYTIQADSRIDSILGSIYRDFREDKRWSPFIGASIGSTLVDLDGAEDSGFTWGVGYGLTYKTSDQVEVFFKGQTLIVPELSFATVNNSTVNIENGNYTNGTIGVRFRF